MNRDFYRQETCTVAQQLLGKTLTVHHPDHNVGGIITETEAYTQEDPACHAYNGKRTPRNRPMFLDGGHGYIYFIYGLYFCLNIVTETNGIGAAVLLRGILPTINLTKIRLNRPGCNDAQLANGPAKLVMALEISPNWNGMDLCAPDSPITISGPSAPTHTIQHHTRIGISKGTDKKWRYRIPNMPIHT